MTLAATETDRPARFDPPRIDHIPGEDGWPIVGNTLTVLKDPLGAADRMYKLYGPSTAEPRVRLPLGFADRPEANELLLFDRDKNFSSQGGWGPVLNLVFPRGLMLNDFDEHRLHRKALGVAFKPAPMKIYLDTLNDGIGQRISEWHLAGTGQGGATNLVFLSGHQAADARPRGQSRSWASSWVPRPAPSTVRSWICWRRQWR